MIDASFVKAVAELGEKASGDVGKTVAHPDGSQVILSRSTGSVLHKIGRPALRRNRTRSVWTAGDVAAASSEEPADRRLVIVSPGGIQIEPAPCVDPEEDFNSHSFGFEPTWGWRTLASGWEGRHSVFVRDIVSRAAREGILDAETAQQIQVCSQKREVTDSVATRETKLTRAMSKGPWITLRLRPFAQFADVIVELMACVTNEDDFRLEVSAPDRWIAVMNACRQVAERLMVDQGIAGVEPS